MVLLGILETSNQVCWGNLEIYFAEQRPTRSRFGHPCPQEKRNGFLVLFRHLLLIKKH